MPREEAEDFLAQTFIYLRKWFNGEDKEQFKMDFKKCSEVYGYKSIAEVEEEELADKFKEIAKKLLKNGATEELIMLSFDYTREQVLKLKTEIA